MIATSSIKAVIGAGITGVSVARFLARQGQAFMLFDTRAEPPALKQLEHEFGSALQLGELDLEQLLLAEEIIVSPGVPLSSPALAAAKEAGIPVLGDIELFARFAQAPIVAITGSNAKSTVTTLVGEMAEQAGLNVGLGGNLGTAALDLLDDQRQLYVLELSSFQLETVSRLNAKVATILNISADHMDRYPNLMAYHAAKLRIYYGAEKIVVNRRDLLTHPPLGAGVKPIYFGGPAEFNSFGLLEQDGEQWLAWQFEPLISAAELKIKGGHNIDNALASLAVGHAAGLPMDAMLKALREFTGLAHRCEWVGEVDGIEFYNDSKGTNVGATLAAINGLAPSEGQLVLIAGGDGKGADFAPLRSAVKKNVRVLVLIGKDAERMADELADSARIIKASTMGQAVQSAFEEAQSGDLVLLSPACASLDMFANYEDRGRQFCTAVKELSQ